MWKGSVQISGASLPVKLYSAVQDRTVHFNIVDDRSMHRVRQSMVNSETQEEVPPAEIRKGYEAAPGEFVILNQEELEKTRPKASRDIEVEQFVKPEVLAPQWFSRPYYLGPDGSNNEYFALAKALADEGVEGLAHWVMRNKRYIGVLRPEGDYLMLVSMRFADEILTARDLPAPSGRDLDAREVKMAQQLIEALKGEFDPKQFNDEYRERVLDLVKAKAAGKKPKLKALPKPKKTESIADALEASLRAAKRTAA
jgi:DNA end-binding protein Ku